MINVDLVSFLVWICSLSIKLASIAAFSPSNLQRSQKTARLTATLSHTMDWDDLQTLRLNVDPSSLVARGTIDKPRTAKDTEYATAIQQAWRQELTSTCTSEAASIIYKDNEGTPLYGHVVRRVGTLPSIKVPGILLFPTAAGPHDICLDWKADSLVTNQEAFPNGCIVLVADILSDDIGWGWDSNREKYNEAKEYVMSPDSSDGVCHRLQSRLQAAVDTLLSIPGVDSTNLAALGWCLGGRAILELGRMRVPGMRAMVTFHGVFDGKVPSLDDSISQARALENDTQVLICNGVKDPFVSREMLDAAVVTLERHSCQVTLTNLEGAKHGFTNPAQDFNPNPSFGFDAKAASASWTAACNLLQSQLGTTLRE